MSEAGLEVTVRGCRRSRVELEQLAREYESSGLTRQAFCAGRGLSVAALDKYRRRHCRAPGSGEGRLVPVEVLTGILACLSTPTICSTENRLFFMAKSFRPRGRGYGRRLTFTVVQNTRGRSVWLCYSSAAPKYIGHWYTEDTTVSARI
jgi:hypothetical protein